MAELGQIVSEHNDHGHIMYGGAKLKARSIPHLVQLQARVRGDAPFIQTWDDGLMATISFEEFSERVVCAAAKLQSKYGIGRGDRCAILSHNSTEYLALSLGIMRCRGVSVNLNWRSPAAQLLELVEKCKCTILFATHHFEDQVQDLAPSVRTVFIEDLQLHENKGSENGSCANISCKPTDIAAVFFTSGSTSLPKAVPHTHQTLMWLQHQYLEAFPAPYQTSDPHAGTLCFFPYFHVMGYSVNMLFNLYAGIRHLLHADAANVNLTPGLLMRACRDLCPTVLNTTPWMVEGFVAALEGGTAPSRWHTSLHFLTYGGAALKPHCGPILRKHNISTKCTYGQTEVGGAVCFGRINGDLNALLPLPGITYKLVEVEEEGIHGGGGSSKGKDQGNATRRRRGRSSPKSGNVGYIEEELSDLEEDADQGLILLHNQDEYESAGGQLVLCGCFCATEDYLPGTAPQARPLTCTGSGNTDDAYRTGDLFEEVVILNSVEEDSGQVVHGRWLYYKCREDDVLVHSTGEMTNPLQTELQVSATCAQFVANVIMVGDGLPGPVMLVQLNEGAAMGKALASKLWEAVKEAQQLQPAYSQLSPDRIVVLSASDSLPVSAKGNVIRSRCERMFQQRTFGEVEWAGYLERLNESSLSSFDSLDFMRQRKLDGSTTASEYELAKRNCYFVAIAGIVIAHLSDNSLTGFFETGEVFLVVFSLFAGMDDQHRTAPVLIKQCLRILAILASYQLVVLPLFRSTAAVACVEGLIWGKGVHLKLDPTPDYDIGQRWHITSYDTGAWFVQILAQMKALAILFQQLAGRTYGRYLLLFCLLVGHLCSPLPLSDSPLKGIGIQLYDYDKGGQQPPPGLNQWFCFPPTTSLYLKLPLQLLGYGFCASNYVLKFIFAGYKGFFFILVYAIGLSVPSAVLLSPLKGVIPLSVLSSPGGRRFYQIAWNFLRAVLTVALVAVLWMLCSKYFDRHNTFTSEFNMDAAAKTLHFAGGLLVVLVVPRTPSVWGAVGQASLMILLLHDYFWLIRPQSNILTQFDWLLPELPPTDDHSMWAAAVRYSYAGISMVSCVLYTYACSRFALRRKAWIEALGYLLIAVMAGEWAGGVYGMWQSGSLGVPSCAQGCDFVNWMLQHTHDWNNTDMCNALLTDSKAAPPPGGWQVGECLYTCGKSDLSAVQKEVEACRSHSYQDMTWTNEKSLSVLCFAMLMHCITSVVENLWILVPYILLRFVAGMTLLFVLLTYRYIAVCRSCSLFVSQVSKAQESGSSKERMGQGYQHSSRWWPWLVAVKNCLSFESETDCPRWMQEWLLFVQTWALYYGFSFVLHQLKTGFCDCRIVLTYFYYELFTSQPVALKDDQFFTGSDGNPFVKAVKGMSCVGVLTGRQVGG